MMSLVLIAWLSPPAAPLPASAAERLVARRDQIWHDETPLADASFRMTCVMEYLSGRGEVTRTLVLEHRRSFRGGVMREELLSAREDGIDVTERERRKEAEGSTDRRGTASRWSLDDTLAPPLPFLAHPGTYQVTAEEPGGTRLAYRPASGASGRLATGWVELDPSDGLPVRQQFVPVPLPRMIRSQVTTVRYGRVRGLAVPESSESIGEGGVLFIKRRFRVTMTYRDWTLGDVKASAR
jgi:hypothetical protein